MESYGTPMAKQLIEDARSMNVNLSANRDLDGIWTVIHEGIQYTIPRKAGAAGACWFLKGIVAQAKSSLSSRLFVPHGK